MGRWIVQQPNGKFGMFSTVVDDFVLYNMHPEEMMCELIAGRGLEYSFGEVLDAFTRARADEHAGYQRGPRETDGLARWREALETIRNIHGDDYAALYEAGDWESLRAKREGE